LIPAAPPIQYPKPSQGGYFTAQNAKLIANQSPEETQTIV
jgi:hypothetical protein